MRTTRLLWIAAATTALLVSTVGPAAAVFPGQPTVSFVRYRDDTAGRVMTMRPNGTEQKTAVPKDAGVDYWSASTSPDGERIVFVRDINGVTDLFVKRAGRRAKRITSTPGRNEYSPTWSPDGTTIVFMETDESSYSAIVTRKADGTKRREAYRTTLDFVFWPSYSPDGRRVLFSAPRQEDDYDLRTMRPDGTGRRWLTDDDSVNEYAGDWSPDGERVAYLHVPLDPRRAGGSLGSPTPRRGEVLPNRIYSLKSGGGGRRLITDKPNVFGRVLYTPDGKRVMFSRVTKDDDYHLFSTPVGGGVFKRLTDRPGLLDVFDWFFGES